MKFQCFTILLLYTFSLLAQTSDIINPTNHLELEESFNRDQAIIPQLRGVILTNRAIYPSYEEIQRAVGNIDTINVRIPGALKELHSLILNKFLNQPLTREDLLKLKHDIILYYRRCGRPIVTLEIPQQNITHGVLQIIITEGKLGKITVEENKYFTKENLRSSIRLKEGQPIDAKILLSDINWINRNPFRKVDVIYTPGSKEGDTDIRLLTLDRRPWKIFSTIDNTGNKETSNIRISAGAIWGNLFNRDHQLSIQSTCAYPIKRLWSLGIHYTIPLPWRDCCSFYGGYSHVHPDLKQENVRNTGYSVQLSMRYSFILSPLYRLIHDLFIGFDYKRMNNNIEFGETNIYQKSIDLAHFALSYHGTYDSKYAKTSFMLELFYSPFKPWLPKQSNDDYNLVRPNAKVRYFYSRCTISPLIKLSKDFSALLTLRGQLASCPLITSEQFGLGGHNTIRGYKEREVNVDNAFLASAELRTRPLFIGKKCFKDGLQFLLFVDYGIGSNIKANPKEKCTRYLLSVGPGVRYEFVPYISFRGDFGIQLHRLNKQQNHRLHFSLSMSY